MPVFGIGDMFTDVIILAGGFGERLWPASSAKFPKQFMSLEGGDSFLQAAIQRAVALNITGSILVITRKEISDTVIDQCSSLEAKVLDRLFVLNEPKPIHTAGAAALGCHFLKKLFPEKEHTILVMTSDHVITPVEAFVSDTEKAYKAAKENNFVCYAIQPEYPCTGFGYIKPGKSLEFPGTGASSSASATQNTQPDLFEIDNFIEKPDMVTAQKYVDQGYFWNSGMFGFSADFFLSELERHELVVYEAFSMLKDAPKPELVVINGVRCMEDWKGLDEVYEKSPKVSIDNGIAEKTDKACAVKASFAWKDIGTWDTFGSLFTNKLDKTTDIESQNCFVYSDIPVALCGVSDLIVVVKNNRVLVMKKGCSSLAKTAAQLIDGE